MNVFPLPLNAVEHYMLADDSADYPRCFSIVLRLRETLNERRLLAAIEVATRRHPLLRALVRFDGDRPIEWIEAVEPHYRVDWRAEPASNLNVVKRHVERLDLKHEPGVRFHIDQHVAGDRLGAEFHHACTDGMGAMQFIGDLLTCYGLGAAGTPSDLSPLDAHRLTTRDNFGLTGWRRPLRWLLGTVGWLGAVEFLMHRPAPLGDPPIAGVSRLGRASGLCAQTLTTANTSALLRAAKESGVTVNDLMMCDLFVTLQEFIASHWPDRAKRHLRIMVPVNLRGAADRDLSATNVVAMINLDRRPHRWADQRRMLRVLHRELAAVKRLRLGVVFVQIIWFLQLLFGSLRRFLPTDRCQATCVASNLGVVLPKIQPDVLDGVEFYPPIRPLTAAAFGVATHGGEMTVSLQFDLAVMTADEGMELLNRYVQRLQETCGDDRCAASGRWYSPGKACRSADS